LGSRRSAITSGSNTSTTSGTSRRTHTLSVINPISDMPPTVASGSPMTIPASAITA
jgi:hypothetical protein